MHKKLLFLSFIHIICWVNLLYWVNPKLFPINILKIAQAQVETPEPTPEPFLGAVYYGQKAIINVFDHHYPLFSPTNDGNDFVTHYDGNPLGDDEPIPTGYGYDQHVGVDYYMEYQPILAAASGEVIKAGWSNPANHQQLYGLHVQMVHAVNQNYRVLYGHMSAITVETGDEITLSDLEANNRTRIIGISGNTGSVRGGCPAVNVNPLCSSHLHLEVRTRGHTDPERNNIPVDPYGWIGDVQDPPVADPWATHPDGIGAVSYNLWQNRPATWSPQYNASGANGPAIEAPPINDRVYIIDDSNPSAFSKSGTCWNGEADFVGINNSYHWALSQEAASTCEAKWTIDLDEFQAMPGEYNVYVHIPEVTSRTLSATYSIHHANSVAESKVVQAVYPNSAHDAWAYIGQFNFAMNDAIIESVTLTNSTIEQDANLGNVVIADAIRLIPVESSSPPLPEISTSSKFWLANHSTSQALVTDFYINKSISQPSGGFGAPVRAASVSRSSASIAYYLLDNDQLWHTNDGGQSFSQTNFDAGGYDATDVFVSYSNPLELWVVVNNGDGSTNCNDSTAWARLYHSTNGGNSWSWSRIQDSEGYCIRSVYRGAVHPTNNQIIYVGGRGEGQNGKYDAVIYRSVDGGASWERNWSHDWVNGPNNSSRTTSIVTPTRGQHAGAVWYAGIWGNGGLSPEELHGIIRKQGSNWTYKAIENCSGCPASNSVVRVVDVAVDAWDADLVLALVDGWGLFHSADGGETWSQVIDSSAVDIDWRIKADPTFRNTFWLTGSNVSDNDGSGLFYSEDGGQTWQRAFTESVLYTGGGNVYGRTALAISPLSIVQDDEVITTEGTAQIIDVLTNDVNPSNLNIESVTQPENGQSAILEEDPPESKHHVTTSYSKVTYTPNPGFIGIDYFTYTARDEDGRENTAVVTVIVGACSSPQADFSASPTIGPAPLSVQFTDQSSCSPTTFTWDFGDGSPPVHEQDPIHSYTESGVYTVSLTVSDGVNGNTKTEVDYIIVEAIPTATATSTSTATATATPTQTPSASSTPIPTSTPSPTQTATGTVPPTATPTATNTTAPTPTPTATPSARQTVRDEFNAVAFSNNDGSEDWATDWIEIGESNGAGGGDIAVRDDSSPPYQLMVRGLGKGLYRTANLSNATSATLTLDYRRRTYDNPDDNVTLHISEHGTNGPWTELDQFGDQMSDSGYTTISYDISEYISHQTTIRFTSSGLQGGNRILFDNIEIAYNDSPPPPTSTPAGPTNTPPPTATPNGPTSTPTATSTPTLTPTSGPTATPTSTPGSDETVRDAFNAVAFNNNDGTQDWATNWVEIGESNGAGGGDIAVRDDSSPPYQLMVRGLGKGLYRMADLASASSATLTLDYRRRTYENPDDNVTLHISEHGTNGPWTELDRFGDQMSDSGYSTISYDISEYISHQTTIRFTSSGLQGGNRILFDNIEIAYGGSPPPPTATPEPTNTPGGPTSTPTPTNTPTLTPTSGPTATPTSPPSGDATVRDAFDTIAFNNNDGSEDWATDWIEIGESNGASGGDIAVRDDSSPPYQLMVRGLGKGLYRTANLANASSATLTLDYRRRTYENPDDNVTLHISEHGTNGPWTELDQFGDQMSDSGYTTISYDISEYISHQTTIRFTSSGLQGGNRILFDNIEIAYGDSPPPPTATPGPTNTPGSSTSTPTPTSTSTPGPTATPTSTPDGDETVRDEFNAIAFNNNDGTKDWASSWMEIGENSGPGGGDVAVYVDVDQYQLLVRGSGKGLYRSANLSGYTVATLTFDYRRRNLDSVAEYVKLEVSHTGQPGSWVELDRFVGDGSGNDASYIPVSYDISPFISSQTTIRLTSYGMESSNRILFDNIQIAFEDTGTPPPPPPTPTPISNNPPTNIELSSSSVDENMAVGTLVGSLTTIDPDAGDSHSYALVAGTGDSDNSKFTLDDEQLKTAGIFNFEDKNSYTVRVRTTDAGGLSFEKQLAITIVDINETPIAQDDTVDPRVKVLVGTDSHNIDVLANDSDEDAGTTLTVDALTQPTNGSATNNDSDITFTAPDSNGSSTFTYQASDGTANSDDAMVTVYHVQNDLRGDCNGDGNVTEADLDAIILEIFDAGNDPLHNGNPAWWRVFDGGYAGSPLGCDANGNENGPSHSNDSVDAGDISCTVLIISGDTSCTGETTNSQQSSATLALQQAQGGNGVDVMLNTNSTKVTSAAFTLALDPALVNFDPTDANGDGIPDTITINAPADISRIVIWNAEKYELQVAMFAGLATVATLDSGVLVTVTVGTDAYTLTKAATAAHSPIRFSHMSLGNAQGDDVAIKTTAGTD